VVVVVVAVAVVLSGRSDDTTLSADSGAGATEQAPAHPWSHVADACDLLDRSAITRWVAESSKPPVQSVRLGPVEAAAAEMRCTYRNGWINEDPQDTNAHLDLQVELADATHHTSFAEWKKLWIDDDSGEFTMAGPVPDLGGQAYYSHWRVDQQGIAGIPPRQSVRHALVVKDGNLAVKVILELTLSDQPHADDQEVATAARRQVDKVFATLRK
jgi:hypothetical protein